MLGVIIGVSAVILLVSIGQGVRSYVTSQVEDLGSNLIFIMPGRVDFGSGGPAGVTNKLTLKHVKSLARQLSDRAEVTAAIESGGQIKYRNETRNVFMYGAMANYPDVIKSGVAEGVFFNDSQVNARRAVCLVGKTIVDDFFGDEDPIGKRVTISGRRFAIIGTLEPKGRAMGVDQDNIVVIPLTTVQSFFGIDKVSYIIVDAFSPDGVGRVSEMVKKALGRYLDPENDFSVQSQGETLNLLQNILGILTLMLGGIAGISLLVGGIGIMNIMLVSVTERTREIGIRKAVGARTFNIMSQFVIEAMTLSIVGGTIGIIIGVAIGAVLKQWLPTETSVWSIALAFGFSAAVGVFFGVYPAYKASRLHPIEALRYE